MSNSKYFAWILFAILVWCVAMATWKFVDEATRGNNATTYRDPGTGCEYLVSPNGTLVPRFNDRRQAGCDK